MLLVVSLLALYFAAAVLSLWLADRFVARVRLRVALFLAFAPFLLLGKAMVTSGVSAPLDISYQAPPLSVHAGEMGTQITQSPILGDVVYLEIPWRKAVREAVKNGRIPLWNRFVLAGEPLLAVQQPAILHPLTWIGMPLPLAQSWTLDMALRYFLALLFAYLFLVDLGCREIPALLGAVAWAFCDYLVFFVGYPQAPAALPLPLLLLGLRRLVTRADRRSVVLTILALLLILTAGHPETLLHCVAGGGIYFLFELAFADPGRRLRPFLLSLTVGALTLGLCAVLLLPLVEALPHTVEHFMRRVHYAHAVRSLPVGESLRQAQLNFLPYLFGVWGKGETIADRWEIAAYAGSLLWPLAVAGVGVKTNARWPLLALGLVGISVGARFPGIADLMASLPFFKIALNDRIVFLGAFALAAFAALGLDRLMRGGSVRPWAAASFVAAVVVGLLAFRAWPDLKRLGMPVDFFRSRLLFQIVFPVVLAGLLLAVRRIRPEVWGGSVLALILIQRGLEERELYPTYSNQAFYPPLASLEKIPRQLPYRFTAVGFSFIPNIAALYELEDVRGYEAMTFRPLFETYSLWSVHQPVWFNRVDDPTKPFLSFLNVRWVYGPPGYRSPPGWPVLYRGREGMLLENPSVLPRAFVPSELAYEPDSDRRVPLLSTVSDFAARGVVGEPAPAGAAPGSWRKNGEASVEIVSYLPQRLSLQIHARESTLVATSLTAWPGWRLTIDDRSADLVSYNHAFLGFRAPPGRHTAILRYWPDGFAEGLTLSMATLLFCAWVSFRMFFGRRIRKGESSGGAGFRK